MVKIRRHDDVAPEVASGYEGVTKRIVLGPAEGSDEIVLRHFRVEEGDMTPRHAHDFPHLVRIEAGQGAAVDADGMENPVSAGDYVYVAPNELHNFKNSSAQPFEFICIVPARGEPPAAS